MQAYRVTVEWQQHHDLTVLVCADEPMLAAEAGERRACKAAAETAGTMQRVEDFFAYKVEPVT